MTCGEYRVVAEPERARERAEEEARRVLDVLRYSLPALYSDRLRVAVGLVGDIGRTVRLTPIFSADNTFFRLATQRIGSLSEFELSAENVQTMTEIGAFEIANLLSLRSKQLSSFEDVLLRAVHWFANAQTQTDQENELLSLVTSLETFFTPEPGEPIADAVARGVACVVSTDPATQAYLYRRMKKLYDERSRIAHGGAKVILRKDLDELELIAAEVIAVLVRRKGEFTGKVGKKALQNWVKKQMLANEHSMRSEEMAD